MKTRSRFVAKFTGLIVAALSCFDRVIFKGHLPISNGPALEGFVDHVLQIRRCDFMAFAERQSDARVDHAKRLAEEAGVEYRFLQGAHREDKLVDEILRRRPYLAEGLVCAFCCMECCPSLKLVSGEARPAGFRDLEHPDLSLAGAKTSKLATIYQDARRYCVDGPAREANRQYHRSPSGLSSWVGTLWILWLLCMRHRPIYGNERLKDEVTIMPNSQKDSREATVSTESTEAGHGEPADGRLLWVEESIPRFPTDGGPSWEVAERVAKKLIQILLDI
jgi:hypothetical protein